VERTGNEMNEMEFKKKKKKEQFILKPLFSFSCEGSLAVEVVLAEKFNI